VGGGVHAGKFIYRGAAEKIGTQQRARVEKGVTTYKGEGAPLAHLSLQRVKHSQVAEPDFYNLEVFL